MDAPIKAVLFDLDDTLWPIAPVIERAETVLHDWLRQHAPRVASQFSIEQLRQRRLALLAAQPDYRINLSALRHAALTEAFLELQEDASLVNAAMEIFLDARHAVSLFDDVMPVLTQLHQRVALGTISNGVSDLALLGLDKYFKVSIAAHSFGTAKPDSAIFHAACEALDVAPSEALYIGDDPECDVAGARKAGLQAVWLNRCGRTLPPHIDAHASCTDLHDMLAWLSERLPLRDKN